MRSRPMISAFALGRTPGRASRLYGLLGPLTASTTLSNTRQTAAGHRSHFTVLKCQQQAIGYRGAFATWCPDGANPSRELLPPCLPPCATTTRGAAGGRGSGPRAGRHAPTTLRSRLHRSCELESVAVKSVTHWIRRARRRRSLAIGRRPSLVARWIPLLKPLGCGTPAVLRGPLQG